MLSPRRESARARARPIAPARSFEAHRRPAGPLATGNAEAPAPAAARLGRQQAGRRRAADSAVRKTAHATYPGAPFERAPALERAPKEAAPMSPGWAGGYGRTTDPPKEAFRTVCDACPRRTTVHRGEQLPAVGCSMEPSRQVGRTDFADSRQWAPESRPTPSRGSRRRRVSDPTRLGAHRFDPACGRCRVHLVGRLPARVRRPAVEGLRAMAAAARHQATSRIAAPAGRGRVRVLATRVIRSSRRRAIEERQTRTVARRPSLRAVRLRRSVEGRRVREPAAQSIAR